MKKSIISIMVIALMTACTNQETIESVPVLTEQSTVKNEIRSYEDALKIAQSSIAMLEGSKASSRGFSIGRKIDLSKSKVVTLDNKTRSDAGIKDTLIYVFNFENNEGFALVSALENTDPLLAITEKGNYDPNTTSPIEGFNIFIELAKEYVMETNVVPVDSIYEFKDSVFSVTPINVVGPYISVRWGQEMTEGEFCSNHMAGCTNVAFAQIMSYYCQPTTLPLTYCNGGNITLNWNNMKNHGTTHLDTNCPDLNTHYSISHFLRELGKLNDSFYDPGLSNQHYTNTDAWTYAPITFPLFGYHVGTWLTSYNGSYLRDELDDAHLILISAGLSHDWVLDGYMLGLITYHTMYKVGNHWVDTGNTHTDIKYLNHHNWGWYGINNGYYNEGVYNSKKNRLLDTGCSASQEEYNFNWNIRYLSVYY